jgi:ethanolamine utilization protein EutA
MSRSVTMVGLDCGSTTSCLVAARGRLVTGVLGRVEVLDLAEFYRSPTIFTPFDGAQIDALRLSAYLDEWLSKGALTPAEIFSGGALITGLAAQRENATAIRDLLRERLADAVVAASDAPRLESWLAFMGNCHAISLANPKAPMLNLDIGGGTTNLAWGIAGSVLATGSLFVGARHFEFEPGTYRLRELSALAAKLLKFLDIPCDVGEELSADAVARIVEYYVGLLREAVTGKPIPPGALPASAELNREHVQAPFVRPEVNDGTPAITLSGGVGQLVYRQLNSGEQFGRSEFGDLGGELAMAIASCAAIRDRLTLRPEGLGHATVFGLLRHSTEVSGATLYLPDPARLPLADVPLVGRIHCGSTTKEIGELLELVAATRSAGALQVELDARNLEQLRSIGQRLGDALRASPLPHGTTLVLLVEANVGKTLGMYATEWGKLDVDLIVIDEIPAREVQFVRLGRLRETIVPMSLYAVR